MSSSSVRFSASRSRWPIRLVCGHDVLASSRDLLNLSGVPCRQCPRRPPEPGFPRGLPQPQKVRMHAAAGGA